MPSGPSLAQRATYADAAIGFHIAFQQTLEAQGPDPLMALAIEVDSSTGVEDYNFIGDLPGFEEWTKDRLLSTIGAFGFQIKNRDWANGIRIHRNEVNDDKMGLIRARLGGLAEKAARHKGDLLAKYLINGFSGTAYPEAGNGLAFDGSLFFADNHALGGGVAQDNKMTSALSKDALIAAELLLASLKTWDGSDPLDMRGTHLIVGPKLEALALELVGSAIMINAAGTAAGSNPYLMGRYKVLVSPRLSGTYDDYWFLADLSKGSKPLIIQNREPITTVARTSWESDPMFTLGEMQFGAQARYGIGLYDWRTIVGSLVA